MPLKGVQWGEGQAGSSRGEAGQEEGEREGLVSELFMCEWVSE